MHEKFENFWASSIQPTFFKLVEYHLLSSILTLRFINFVKFNFGKSYVIGFPYKQCYVWLLCLPVKTAPKTVIRPGPNPSLFVFSGNEQVNWIANLTENLLINLSPKNMKHFCGTESKHFNYFLYFFTGHYLCRQQHLTFSFFHVLYSEV